MSGRDRAPVVIAVCLAIVLGMVLLLGVAGTWARVSGRAVTVAEQVDQRPDQRIKDSARKVWNDGYKPGSATWPPPNLPKVPRCARHWPPTCKGDR